MGRVRIVTDSTADIPPALANELGITVVPLNVHFGRETFRDGIDLTTDRFYEKLVSGGVHPTTSQPSVGAFLEVYERLGAEADQIISIHISAKLSGTMNSAQLARQSYQGNAQIELIDSLLASLGLGLVALQAAEAARDGSAADEIVARVRDIIPRIHCRFFVETLEYLQRGGRIGRAQALLGGLLNIKPFLKLEDGVVHPVEKIRTRGKALERMIAYVHEVPQVERLAIAHVNTPEDVARIVAGVADVVPRDRIIVGQIGPVVGTHVGPGGVGVMVQQGSTG